MYAFVHQCCCLALIYKPKGARTATRQRSWQRKEKIISGGVSPSVIHGDLKYSIYSNNIYICILYVCNITIVYYIICKYHKV